MNKQIINQSFSQTNKSTSKQAFSFPKQRRFKQEIRQSTDQIYNIPSFRDKRSASIGTGQKGSSFIMRSSTPGPNQYNTSAIFEKQKSKGLSFGVSRDKAIFGQSFNLPKFTPGPQSYHLNNMLSKVSYSMRQKTNAFKKDERLNTQTPGPCFYNTTQYNQLGSYKLSKFISRGNCKICPLARKPINASEIIPGPGAYQSEIKNNQGKFIVSKFRNSKMVTIGGHGINKSRIIRSTTPGPGSYQIPSDFCQSFVK
ncbi:hypothetical protein PPERSA_07364 [Pseudocohnilembus persalinus]|uniref:Sperm-tail PG-rich repeat n=1 Tax=Pseudocohnilembus persalinus TaxID=266149 RepID=A0A0V0Q9G0_PSEPJ|nr:hypothetical protein PPERSA_07364 [Pseudocohnilembus persalinus]|eukprot:KRW98866.1 hypothetical protein PPERSA_07364 [Pseudocohnilembus persalinus]